MPKPTPKAEAALAAAVHLASGLPPDDPLAETGPTPNPLPTPADLRQAAPGPKGPAAWAYERLILYIRNFEQQLDANEEVAMGFAGSDAGVLKIEGLGFFDPDLITFYGRDEDGMKTQLVQHVSQLSVMLRATPKPEPAAPARRIGFHLAPGWIGGEAGDGSV
jgi:hypothetical protein